MLNLTLTTAALERLHKANNMARRSATSIKVDRQALTDLLLDYSRLLNAVPAHAVRIPPDKET